MTAGVVTYKLCDRGFDCEHCPFDAALRGRAETVFPGRRTPPGRLSPWSFPEERVYTSGHLWVAEQGPAPAVLRLGLDAFAAVLLGRLRRMRWPPADRVLVLGESACELDLDAGLLPLATPVAARMRRGNPTLESDPHLALVSPYEAGWLVEIEPEETAELPPGLDAGQAREQARLDLRHFRRRVALALLDDHSVGPTLPDGGVPLTDLGQILGGPRYLALLRELIH
jgi:glycine cleavage system H protein